MSVSATDFDYVRRLVRDRTAQALGEDKGYLVESRLAPLAAREGLDSVGDLVARAREGSLALRAEVVEAMATHETSFFRDVHPFDALREQVMPEILARCGDRPPALWSAAASTGQEAYSLAMLMLENFPQVRPVILGSDFSHDVIEKARTARYTQLEVNRGLPASLLVKYFESRGRHWTLSERVRELVIFRDVNLAKPFPALPTMDVVFLRNVLIYLDPAVRELVLQRVARVLRPGGYLFLGAAETVPKTPGVDALFERVDRGRSVCYRSIGHSKETAS